MLLLLPGGASFSQSVDIPGGGGEWDPIPCGGDPIQCLNWGKGEGVVTLSQVASYGLNRNGYGNVIFSVSLLTSQVGVGWGGWDPSHMGGPHSMLELGGGGGVVTLSQVAFYGLNRNGYGNVIFSVSLLTSQVGVGPHSMLELGGGGGNIIPGCFLWSQ